MIWLPVAFASAIIFGVGGFLLKVGSHHQYPRPSMLLGLYFAGSLIFFIAMFMSGPIEWSWLAFLFSILIGLGSYYGNTFLVRAYDTGPAAITSPLMSINTLLVIIMSAIVYNEAITPWQYVGVAFLVLAVTLLSCKFDSSLIKSPAWILFVILAILFVFMREGGLKIAHEYGLNNIMLLFFGYILAGIFSIINLILIDTPSISTEGLFTTLRSEHGPALLLGATIGIFSAIGMGLLAFAISRGPASIVVPIFSIRNFMTTVLFVMFFREKLSLMQWIAVGLLIIGIILIS